MKKQKGKVRWFDNLAGEGFIRVGDKNIYVHYSAIDRQLVKKMPNKKWNKDFYYRILFPNQEVNVTIFEDSHYIQIDKVW
jgi:hypothetical protein